MERCLEHSKHENARDKSGTHRGTLPCAILAQGCPSCVAPPTLRRSSPFLPPTHTMYELSLPHQLDFVPDFDSSWMFLVFIGKVFLAGVLLGILLGLVIYRLLEASCGRCAWKRCTPAPTATSSSEGGGSPPHVGPSTGCQTPGIGCNVTTQSQTTYKWYASKPHFHPLVEGLHGAWVQRAKTE